MSAADFSTYAGLQDAVAQWLNRRDLTDQIPGFIRLAEAKFNRELRVRDMQMRTSGSATGELVAVPADFLAPYSLELEVTANVWSEPLEYISEDEAKHRRNERATQTKWYTIFGSNFELVAAPSASAPVNYKLKYYGVIPALSGSNTSNWLLAKSPDLYLYGACLEAAPYLKNDDRLGTWATMRQQVIDAMNIESERALKPQAKLVANRRSF